MIPTVTTIRPNRGHTGGATLLEIVGSGFAETPASTDGKVKPSRVRVTVGGAACEGVEVESSTVLYAFTPIHDPGLVSVVVENLAETPATLTSEAGPFALANGQVLSLVVDGALPAQSVTFLNADFVSIAAATPAEVAVVINRLSAVKATVQSGQVVVTTDSRGLTASLEALPGAAATALGLPTTKATGTEDLVPIAGESATVANAFTFARPSLSAELPITKVLGQLQVEMRRQIVPDVNFATHTDFDDDTGDQLSTTYLAKLPGIVLGEVKMTMSPLNSYVPESSDPDASSDGRSLVRDGQELVDLTIPLIFVSDSPIELFNLVAITKRVIRKMAKLRVDINGSTEEFTVHFEVGVEVNVTAKRGDGNLHTATGQMMVRTVPIGDFAIDSEGTLPAGSPAGTSWEGVREIGFPQVAIDVDVEPA